MMKMNEFYGVFIIGASDKEYSRTQPISEGSFDGHNVSLVAPLDESSTVPS